MEKSTVIISIGEIDKLLLEKLADVLSKRFKISFKIEESIEIPSSSFCPTRNQYDSSKILKKLHAFQEIKVLGIIDKDIYVQGLNFVFGQAELPGIYAIISITRLKQEFYGLPKDNKIFFDRVVKEAIHELGHTYGLKHCSNGNCVMRFSNSIIDTDRKNLSFCNICGKKLRL